jgi:hypothetical protein
VAEAWALYHVWYPVPPNIRLPSSGSWKMAANGIGVPPLPAPDMQRWRGEIKAHRRGARRSHLGRHRKQRMVVVLFLGALQRRHAHHRRPHLEVEHVEQ